MNHGHPVLFACDTLTQYSHDFSCVSPKKMTTPYSSLCRSCLLNSNRWSRRPRRLCLPLRARYVQPIRQFQTSLHQKSEPAETEKEPLIYPSSPSQNHHDLPSFLSYAERTCLSPTSTVYIGTHYEYTVSSVLSSHGFNLRRIGGPSDFGIDLLGTWSLPSLSQPLRVIVQCKGLSSRSGPHLIRELEGAFAGAPPGWRGDGVVGLLAAPGHSTKGVRDAMTRSKWPMGFVSCSREEGKLKQFLWNQAAVKAGLEGVGVGFRYDGAKNDPSLILTWQGKQLEYKADNEEG